MPTKDQIIAELTKERDYWRRLAKRRQRQLDQRTAPANEARARAADEYAAKLAPIIRTIRLWTNDEIAAELERRGIKTPSGNSNWTRAQVRLLLNRIAAL